MAAPKAQIKNKELSNGCSMYDPCPICFKCKVKASHLYQRCVECPVQFCGHSEKQRAMVIRRENFAINVTDETAEKLKKWMDEKENTCQCE